MGTSLSTILYDDIFKYVVDIELVVCPVDLKTLKSAIIGMFHINCIFVKSK